MPYPTYLYSLVWTKFSLDIHLSAYPTYLSNQFGNFGPKVCSQGWCQKHSEGGGPLVFMVALDKFQQFQGDRDHFQDYQGGFWNFGYFYKYGPISDLPTSNFFVQTFLQKKVWLINTLPTYGLDICPIFCGIFF